MIAFVNRHARIGSTRTMEGGLLLSRHVAFFGYRILNKRGKTMWFGGAFGTGDMWPVSDGFCDLVFHKKGN